MAERVRGIEPVVLQVELGGAPWTRGQQESEARGTLWSRPCKEGPVPSHERGGGSSLLLTVRRGIGGT